MLKGQLRQRGKLPQRTCPRSRRPLVQHNLVPLKGCRVDKVLRIMTMLGSMLAPSRCSMLAGFVVHRKCCRSQLSWRKSLHHLPQASPTGLDAAAAPLVAV